MGYVSSTPCPAMEVESTCPPFNIRCRWLAGKFLLKSLSYSDHRNVDTYYSLYLNWRYVPKSMPVLSIIAHYISNVHQYIIKSTKLPLYEQSYDSLIFSPQILFDNQFLDLSSNDFKSMSSSSVNAAVLNYLNERFFNFTTIYTDGSVSPLSTGYAFYIPNLQLSFTNNLPPTSSSFTAECFVSDSMSCLQALSSNPFNSHLSPLILRIKFLIFTLNQKNYNINLLWVPSHTGIHGNEVADHLAKSFSNLIFPSFSLLPHSDFTPLIKQHSTNTWLSLSGTTYLQNSPQDTEILHLIS